MPALKTVAQREVSGWVFIAIACVGAVILGYVGWQAIFGKSADPGPPKKVTPGMYDLRAEAAKARAAQEQGAAQDGSER